MTAQRRVSREEVQKVLERQPRGSITILSSLLALEDAFGYVPSEGVEEVAEFLGVTVNDVWGVASFYTNFRFTPPGDHIVEVCWGPSCHLVGAPDVIRSALEALGLEAEGDTSDGGVTLKYNTCLGACAQAPVMSLDHRLVGRLTLDEARRRIEALRQPGRAAHHA